MRKPELLETLDELRTFLRIDPNDLDQALEEQAEIFDRVADAYEVACSLRDYADAELKEIEAEEMQRVRKRFAKEKKSAVPTDTAMKEEVYLLAHVKDARLRHIDAKLLAGRWKALKEAFEQRSYMITGSSNRQVKQVTYNEQRDGKYGTRGKIAEAALGRIKEERRGNFRDLRDRR